ncbi:hypothetical protein OIDMADRAFT_105644 [Oidiodendron maius Zn]|uniref:Zn(2)-C6 fungal-type domain-containing protein n=1 Tax=Oidiodendron maius (strain Zn) TaxID=913774 RepID=A0A0C3D5S5_OIDMZ|nr:hypothetical protein OIDMADRAFT_105644 [Oidiodendron maius Zn]
MELPLDRPRFACAACKRLKKRCDRREPRCTYCLRSANRGISPPSETASRQFEDDTTHFPAVYFLNSDLFQRSIGQLSSPPVTLAPELQSFVRNKSNMRDHATSYFTKIHPWIPFISKRVFYEGVLSSFMPTPAEHVLLLAAVKLVTTSPTTQDARSMIYKHIKAMFTELEVIGQLTLKTLQALTLLALYELGHAVYPAAYLTIGLCARYGIALGLDETVRGIMQSSWNMIDLEEKRRTWWAIVILDRFVHLGCPEKTPVTAEPTADSVLPMDDQLWDTNTSESVHTLSSPPTPTMGRFGLTVQAGILLGKALRNLRDSCSMPQGPSRTLQDDEAEVLENTIFALAKVSSEEARARGIGICGLTKMCYRQSNAEEKDLYIASQMVHIGTLNDTLTYPGTQEEVSPFLLDAVYRSAIIYMQEYVSTGSQDLLRGINEFRSALEKINGRWKAAGIYLQLLEAHDTTNILR